ncbi:MAG: glycosyltransferase family 4 protein [Vicinamibacterales bacterium]
MHILMTTDTVGGVWTYSLGLAAALYAAGVDVTLAVVGPGPSAAQRADLRELKHIVWCHHPCRLEWMPNGLDDVERTGEWLCDLAEDLDPTVVHLNGYAYAAWPFRCPVLIVGHSCVCTWWRAVKGKPAPKPFATYQQAVKRGLDNADLVVAPTFAMDRALIDEHSYAGPSHVIANGSDLRRAHVDKEPFVFAAGRFDDEAKNVSLLQRAAPAMEWSLFVAGSTTQPPDPPIRYLGSLPRAEIAAWLSRAAIYALPVRYEPFGLSILEAARAGCALVVGDIPSMRELWDTAAIFVEPNDPGALAREVNRLARDPACRRSMANKARRRAERYTLAACAAEYVQTYCTLVAEGVTRERAHLV